MLNISSLQLHKHFFLFHPKSMHQGCIQTMVTLDWQLDRKHNKSLPAHSSSVYTLYSWYLSKAVYSFSVPHWQLYVIFSSPFLAVWDVLMTLLIILLGYRWSSVCSLPSQILMMSMYFGLSSLGIPFSTLILCTGVFFQFLHMSIFNYTLIYL